MAWQKIKMPKLSKEAMAWDKKCGSPDIRPTRTKQEPATHIIMKCAEGEDAELFEDIQNGNLIYRECGLCERIMISDDFDWAHVDRQGSSLVHKSQHQPSRYFWTC